MGMYERLSPELSKRIRDEQASGSFLKVGCDDENAARRRDDPRDRGTVWRPAFIRDIDKIINCPFYNRYADKTQVFSFYKNDDITRRGLHVQLVSRIARTVGRALNLNLDLIEAIALGHDIGHTPFGHTGERFLDKILFERTGRHFAHNLQSVRVLDLIFPYNISLQTLTGIAAHDGELELCEYRPRPMPSFHALDETVEDCCLHPENIKKLVPDTLEGCVVRICDIIAYLGKDRQDGERVRIAGETDFLEHGIGNINAEIINNLIVNIIENSYGKDYIALDAEHFDALQKAKRDNYAMLYRSNEAERYAHSTLLPMMQLMFDRITDDLRSKRTSSPVYSHHIDYVSRAHYKRKAPYSAQPPELIAADYIASMTDDYFIDLFAHLFPDIRMGIEYKGYFD